jgi:hypothetical protein
MSLANRNLIGKAVDSIVLECCFIDYAWVVQMSLARNGNRSYKVLGACLEICCQMNVA